MQTAERKAREGGAAPEAGHAGKDSTQLMKAGTWFLSTGGVAVLMLLSVFGGVGVHGPHTNGGWLLLVLAFMCFPLGVLLLALGGAKWMSQRR